MLRMTRAGRSVLGVQSLRAVAAIAVVVYHATDRAGATIAIGQAGVDAFFVVSGFIMWAVRSRTTSAIEFAIDRVLRIAPIYWIATASMVIGGLLGIFPTLKLSAPHIAASFLFVPYPSPSGGGMWPILVQGWTLNYEMFFYGLFALILMLPRNAHLPLLCVSLMGVVAFGKVFEGGSVWTRAYADPILLEFAAGACIGALWERGLTPGRLLAGSALFVGACAIAAQGIFPIAGERALLWGLPAAMIVLGIVSLDRVNVVVGAPVLLFLGNASFSIYLFHTFGISAVARASGGQLGYVFEALLAALAGVLVGICGYLLLERPIAGFIGFRRHTPARANAPAITGLRF